MDEQSIIDLVKQQKKFFSHHKSIDVDFRKKQLLKLSAAINKYELEIIDALYKDLHRPETEAYSADIFSILDEIKYAVKSLNKWSRPQKIKTPLILQPGKAFISPDPYGVVLILSPWNYPIDLALSPLIGAISAGNTAIIKPSEHAPNCSKIIAKIIASVFEKEYVAVVEGDAKESSILLKEKFDYIFFTGGETVGKIVAQAAAKHLTPVTLELGGKSPCIVDKHANIDVAARRIAWGNSFNAGQTCISPDYLYVHEEVKDEFVEAFKKANQNFFKNNKETKDYSRIVNKNHFTRISKLMQDGDVLVGGNTDENELYIEPTLIGNVSKDDRIMQEEIFGPVMPMLVYKELDEVIDYINSKPKPLALYFFSHSLIRQNKILKYTSSGGVAINDVLAHYRNKNLPFGGVGTSGMGAYHHRKSFDTFSHLKSVQKRTFFDLGLENAPYNLKLKTLKMLLRLFA